MKLVKTRDERSRRKKKLEEKKTETHEVPASHTHTISRFVHLNDNRHGARRGKNWRRGEYRRLAAGVVGWWSPSEGWTATRDSQSAHCPAHPARSAAIVGGEAGMSLPPRALYGRSSAYDGIAVTLDDSIHRDYVLDNVCFVQTWLPPTLSLIRLI